MQVITSYKCVSHCQVSVLNQSCNWRIWWNIRQKVNFPVVLNILNDISTTLCYIQGKILNLEDHINEELNWQIKFLSSEVQRDPKKTINSLRWIATFLNTLLYRLIIYIMFKRKICTYNLWATSEDDLYFFLSNCLRYRLISINDNNVHDFQVPPVVCWSRNEPS